MVYLLYGLCGSNGDWVDFIMLLVYFDNYDVIFIMLEVVRSFYIDMKYGVKFFIYIIEELLFICKSFFNILLKREDIMVIGGFMGGYGVLKCVLLKFE